MGRVYKFWVKEISIKSTKKKNLIIMHSNKGAFFVYLFSLKS